MAVELVATAAVALSGVRKSHAVLSLGAVSVTSTQLGEAAEKVSVAAEACTRDGSESCTTTWLDVTGGETETLTCMPAPPSVTKAPLAMAAEMVGGTAATTAVPGFMST